jgi:drug/metabolite transporter (DMT)-like permease
MAKNTLLVPYLMMVLAAAVFGSSSVIIKYIYGTGLTAVTVLVIQGVLATGLAWLWVMFPGSSPCIPGSLVFRMFCQGAIGSFLSVVLFYSALQYVGAALATLLLFTYPAFVLLYEKVCYRHPVRPNEKIAFVLAFLGLGCCVNLVELQWGTGMAWGIMLALGSALTNAFLYINGEKLLAVVNPQIVTAWSLTVSTLLLVAVYQPLWLLGTTFSWQQVVLLIASAITFVVPLMLYLAAIRRIGAGVAARISILEIPFTILLAGIVLQENLNWVQAIGGALITVSVLLIYWQPPYNEEEK